MIRPGRATLCFLLIAGVALSCSCSRDNKAGRSDLDDSPLASSRAPLASSSAPLDTSSAPPVSEFVMTVTDVREGKILLRVDAGPGDLLEFGWVHSVEHFPWTEFFTLADDRSLILREMRVRGYGAGIPHQRSSEVRTEDGWIISSGIDEVFPSYNWINSHTAVGQVRLNGTLLFAGSDFPHHEALVLRVEPRRKP